MYITTESVNSENEYFKRLLKAMLEIEWVSAALKASHKASDAVGKVLDTLKSISILGSGIELNDSQSVCYEEEFLQLLKSFPFEGRKVVLMVDAAAESARFIVPMLSLRRFCSTSRARRICCSSRSSVEREIDWRLRPPVERRNALGAVSGRDVSFLTRLVPPPSPPSSSLL